MAYLLRSCGHISLAEMDADLELLEQWRAGDKRAGEDLFRRHFASVLRFFGNKATRNAEDLTQQTFLECARSRDSFRGTSSFRSYLFAIAWNQLRHYYRRERKTEQLDFEASSINDLVGTASSPSSKLGRAQRGQRLHEALIRLPLAQQVLLECHYWQDLDATALAEIFGVPAGTIRVRLLRARSALRDQVAKLEPTTHSRPDPDNDPLAMSLRQFESEDSA